MTSSTALPLGISLFAIEMGFFCLLRRIYDRKTILTRIRHSPGIMDGVLGSLLAAQGPLLGLGAQPTL